MQTMKQDALDLRCFHVAINRPEQHLLKIYRHIHISTPNLHLSGPSTDVGWIRPAPTLKDKEKTEQTQRDHYRTT